MSSNTVIGTERSIGEDPLLRTCVAYVYTYGLGSFQMLIASIRKNPVYDKKSHVLQRAKEVFKGAVSIDGTGEEGSFIESFVSEEPDPLDTVINKSSEETLHALMHKLSLEEQGMMCRRFGFYQYEQTTLHTVCKYLGITYGRGRHIEKMALKKLRSLMDENHLTKECF